MKKYKRLIDLSTLRRNPKRGQPKTSMTISFGKYCTEAEFFGLLDSEAFASNNDKNHQYRIIAMSRGMTSKLWIEGKYEGYRDGDYDRPYGGFITGMFSADLKPNCAPYEKIDIESAKLVPSHEDYWLPYKYQI